MPAYEYRCDVCALSFTSGWRDDEMICVRCTRMARRVWGFSILPSFPGVPAAHVSDLARASEEASSPQTLYDADGNAHAVERPEHRFVPVDLRDREALGVTSEGLDSTYDQLRRVGNDPAADRLRKVMD
ncbi:MAG TPA: hypothetical protein VH419_06820 [Nocardioidaceae bacterium]